MIIWPDSNPPWLRDSLMCELPVFLLKILESNKFYTSSYI